MCFAAMKWIQYWKAKLTNKKMLTITKEILIKMFHIKTFWRNRGCTYETFK